MAERDEERLDVTAGADAAEEERRRAERRESGAAFATVRDEDLEPHEGLRYIARLFKVLSVFPENYLKNIPSHQGAILVFETETGRLKAIVDAEAVTAVRTAASRAA